MYDDAEAAIDRILAVTNKCPANLQDRCFEVLLRGYVEKQLAMRRDIGAASSTSGSAKQPLPADADTHAPPAVVPRFKSTAKRLSVDVSALEGLFDFSNDPFTLHAVSVPGNGKAEKVKNVGLLLAAKSYLANGAWSADWQELKSYCVDQNCYDQANHAATIRKSAWFKNINPGKPLELSSEGVKEAEKLLAQVAQAE
jgi:hypothetical protein